MAKKLDFEDVPLADGTYERLTTYHGLTWQGFAAYDPDPKNLPGNGKGIGYVNGITSGEQNVFTYDYGATISVEDGTFDFKRAYVTAAFKPNTITAIGYLDGDEVYRLSFETVKKAPTLVQFDFKGIDAVSFIYQKASQTVFDDMVFGRVRTAESPAADAFGHDSGPMASGAAGLHSHAEIWQPGFVQLA